jgi:hypothetical protein
MRKHFMLALLVSAMPVTATTPNVTAGLGFDCLYDSFSDGHAVQPVTPKPMRLAIMIDDLRAKHPKAYLLHDGQSVRAAVLSLGSGYSFLGVADRDSFSLTSVGGTVGRGAYHSVHSQHIQGEGRIVATQYYGSCRRA